MQVSRGKLYAKIAEDDPSQKFTSTGKRYAPVTNGCKTFTPSQIKMSIYAKEFLRTSSGFKEFEHIFWSTPKPFINMTGSKSVTRFFRTENIPPLLWNTFDSLLQFMFAIAQIPGKVKTAADFLLCLETDPNEEIILKIIEVVPTKPIEVNIESTEIAQPRLVFFILQR